MRSIGQRTFPAVGALLLILAVGCGRVEQAHRVAGPFDNPPIKGFYYDRFRLAEDAARAIAGRTLRVEVEPATRTLVLERSKITAPVEWEAWGAEFEQTLADKLWQSRVFDDVCTTSETRPILKPDLILRVALTEFHEGNAFLRYVPGFGAGATRVQWEAELVENGEGEERRAERPLFVFADARLHPGGPYLGWSFKPWNGRKLIVEDLHLATEALVKDLRWLTGTRARPLPEYFRRPQTGPYRTARDEIPLGKRGADR
jgi:hypothetical protein